MKVIDLLNRIANGEENIRVKHKLFELDYINMENMNIYYPEKINSFSLMTFIKSLNDEVEMIEEDRKIEKLRGFDLCRNSIDDEDLELHYTGVSDTFNEVYFKINEIIDYINKGEN